MTHAKAKFGPSEIGDEFVVEQRKDGWFVIDEPYDDILAGPFPDYYAAAEARDNEISIRSEMAYERLLG